MTTQIAPIPPPGTLSHRYRTGWPKRTVHSVFERIRADLGWGARGGHPAPRLHDLRHTFICRRLMLWHEHGTDIDSAMLALSTYVGHLKVSDAY